MRTSSVLANRFKLLRRLADGGMGELWVAEHLGLGHEVVVKFIAASLSASPRAAERFAHEAAAAARVNSPHVVRVLDYGVSAEGAPFLVMEKLEGRDLGAYLGERRVLAPAVVSRIIRHVALGLSKTHAAGIVHRDVKPSNVFLCCHAEGEIFVKLLDFGVAKSTTDAMTTTGSGSCVGTPAYMSPEQIFGSRTIDLRSDVWSLGVLAFQCLTGRKPFEGETLGALALTIHTKAPPTVTSFAPLLPVAIDAWFARACAREPASRFGSAMELANALTDALALPREPATAAADEEPTEALALPRTLTAGATDLLPMTYSSGNHERPSQGRSTLRYVAAVVAVASTWALAAGGAAYGAHTHPAVSAPPAPGASLASIEPRASVSLGTIVASPAATAREPRAHRSEPARSQPAKSAARSLAREVVPVPVSSGAVSSVAASTESAAAISPAQLYVMPNARH